MTFSVGPKNAKSTHFGRHKKKRRSWSSTATEHRSKSEQQLFHSSGLQLKPSRYQNSQKEPDHIGDHINWTWWTLSFLWVLQTNLTINWKTVPKMAKNTYHVSFFPLEHDQSLVFSFFPTNIPLTSRPAAREFKAYSLQLGQEDLAWTTFFSLLDVFFKMNTSQLNISWTWQTLSHDFWIVVGAKTWIRYANMDTQNVQSPSSIGFGFKWNRKTNKFQGSFRHICFIASTQLGKLTCDVHDFTSRNRWRSARKAMPNTEIQTLRNLMEFGQKMK